MSETRKWTYFERLDQQKESFIKWQSHFDKEYKEKISAETLNPMDTIFDDAIFYKGLSHNPHHVNMSVPFHLMRNFLSRTRRSLMKVQRWVESPIERFMLESLIVITGGANIIKGEDSLYIGDNNNGYSITLQYKISNYRVDFLIKRIITDVEYIQVIEGTDLTIIKEVGIIVECDGEDYHSSEEQLAKDNVRDKKIKNLINDEYNIMRFEGKDIWQNPFDVAKKIIHNLDEKYTQVLENNKPHEIPKIIHCADDVTSSAIMTPSKKQKLELFIERGF